jgi:hypothetical protein
LPPTRDARSNRDTGSQRGRRGFGNDRGEGFG